ncbi:beta-lactamase-like protein [Cokeromyces recurvatus]|uniref:beta-lactamase-like protein n=1 Tax=Cokeromyces recurvatus TaxID=90255 RepID=UPI00221FB686|nr:beta-lactamase-like protein [Cokeromyces recurvatus]KAI7905013.1 beta-lactamase-like protein [Cokeromyces recurvatus]
MVAPMDITFLGTGSAQPSATRNHQAIALRLNGEIWLFDCGEATQHQFQKSKLKMSKITRIFITHMHGDHCFGLAPLLCSMTDNLNPANACDSKDELEEGSPIIDIYGPSPLRSWLRTTLLSTYSNLGRSYRVHELLHSTDPVDLNENRHPNELPGENVRMEADHLFRLPLYLSEEKGYQVQAAPIQHSIPSLGYVIREPDWPGKVSGLIPLIKKNWTELRASGIANPMSLLGHIQRTNQPYHLPDGSQLVPPPLRPGRQIVILGDTNDPSQLLPAIRQDPAPTLLVHEATNALTSLDTTTTSSSHLNQSLTFEDVESKAKSHGHSTPQMAALFAKRINCKKLILTHFSARYRGDNDPEALKVMEEIRALAVNTWGDQRDKDVFCAQDLWTYDIKLE